MAKTKVDLSDEKAVIARIVELRSADTNWKDIVDEIGMSSGKVMLLHLKGTIKPAQKYKGTTDAQLAKEVAASRKAGESWGIISVKGGFSEARARNLFEQATGKSASGDRIGKGGRHPNGVVPAAAKAPAKAPAAKKGTSKAPASKKAATKGGGSAKKAAGSTKGLPGEPAEGNPAKKGPIVPLVEMTLEQLQERLNGKVITVGRSSKTVRIQVTHVTALDGEGDDGVMTVTDAKNGVQRSVKVQDVVKASR